MAKQLSKFDRGRLSHFKEDTGEPSVPAQEFNPIACTPAADHSARDSIPGQWPWLASAHRVVPQRQAMHLSHYGIILLHCSVYVLCWHYTALIVIVPYVVTSSFVVALIQVRV